MLLTESVCGVLGILGFLAALLLWRPRPAPAAATEPVST
jgi:hypothetical protein